MPESFTPTLKCNRENDRFTIGDRLGNGDLTYSIGMLTVDELYYAGLIMLVEEDEMYINNESYLYTLNAAFWTMTPANFISVFGVIYRIDINSTEVGIRPVISVSIDAITGGTGIITNLFVITTE